MRVIGEEVFDAGASWNGQGFAVEQNLIILRIHKAILAEEKRENKQKQAGRCYAPLLSYN